MMISEHGVQAGRTDLSNCESRKVATPFYLAVTGVVRLQHVYRFDTPCFPITYQRCSGLCLMSEVVLGALPKPMLRRLSIAVYQS